MVTPKKTKNDITRELLNPIIDNIEVGTVFICGDIVASLSKSPRRSGRNGVCPRQVAPFLSERNDLKLISRVKGLWKKVKEENV